MQSKKGSVGIVVALGGLVATAIAIKELSQRDWEASRRRKLIDRCDRNARELAARMSRSG